MARTSRLTEAQVINALHATKGAVYLAATSLGCSHTAIYQWLGKSAKAKAIKAYYDGELVDIAEAKVRTAIFAGEPWAIKMVLMTKGKDRGYTERVEVANERNAADQLIPFKIVDYRATITEAEE